MLWRNNRNGRNTIWKSANRSTEQAVAFVSDLNYVVAGVGDFNGDGKSDILWRNIRTGRNTIWKSGDRATEQAMGSVANLRWKIAAIGDYNGDGRSEERRVGKECVSTGRCWWSTDQ